MTKKFKFYYINYFINSKNISNIIYLFKSEKRKQTKTSYINSFCFSELWVRKKLKRMWDIWLNLVNHQ